MHCPPKPPSPAPMRLKDPFSLKPADMTKRTSRPKKTRDEESSDEISGLTCQHVSKAVDLSSVKKAVAQNLWSVCTDCLRERTVIEGEPAGDVLLCLRCGFQGCNQLEVQHSARHQVALRSECHCISVSLSTWKAWCLECNEELSTHCNKKVLAQTLDFLQKHSVKAASGALSKVIKLREEPLETTESLRGKVASSSSSLIPVKGISNLGNTCFFNAVMQNLSQTHLLNELILEVKEKGHRLKICPLPDANLAPLVVTLPSPEPLTSALLQFLHSMKEPGRGPVSPKGLFNQLCQKAPRFKGYQQQDSQELLHYLLDSIRMEETKRIKASILKAFNNPTEKTADEETKRQVKAYGKEGVKMNFVDRIFVGELTNTIMCEECQHISTVKEAFIDISLPIIEERSSKPTNPARSGKGSRELEVLLPRGDETPSPMPPQVRNGKRLGSQQGGKSLGVLGERGTDRSLGRQEDLGGMARGGGSGASDRDTGLEDSSNDADSEASESESSSRLPGGTVASPASLKVQQGGAVQQLVSAVSRLGLGPACGEAPASHLRGEEQQQPEGVRERHQGAFQALSHSYTPYSKECSIQSCLHQFTSVELLMGNNRLLCENCTEMRWRQLRRSPTGDKKTEKVYTSARKQMLISMLPPVVTLHLKRFHQAGVSLRKVNRHVDFPLVLDLAPFCSASCKNMGAGERVLYSLYGIVEHSGSMRGGHYAAYVKIRSPQRRVSLSGPREGGGPSSGQWVYVSDTSVQVVAESRVLGSQAYLLFYEELL
ncbi:ubiquitin carboxyl-terminal hydrolase 45 isoform X2 [Brienomyrus brachyistius]|uniref:ubiquitin carboxyl-terminal hydrolase 45 isoform X2 n=1 Tax=Brienomyrus brachyistius TaxID=42636 RepID=UPI0020B1FF44|nr:ubiquitin carboxyl-terminal hydrolase 45 isoform X2 [Brienomyrus brachyistius]